MDVACIANYRVPSDFTPVIQTMRLCEGFTKAGHDITLYHPDRSQPPKLQNTTIEQYYDINNEFETKSFPCIELESSNSRGEYSLVSATTLSRATFTVPTAVRMRWVDSDVYITRGVPTAALLVSLGLPTILESYSGTFYETSPDNIVLQLMDRSSAFKGVVVPTEEIARNWQSKGVSPEKTVVIPTAINHSNYESPKSKAEARRELGLPEDRDIVVYTGKLIPARGSRVLMDACADLDGVDVVLVGGTDEEVKKVQTYIDTHDIDNVHVEGWVDPPEVPTYQWAADVLASATKPGEFNPMEAVPLKIIEYMAAERPIVASNIEGIRTVLEDEKSGLLPPPGDRDALREAIERVLDDPDSGEILAANAAEKAAEYSWERRAQRILNATLDQ